MGKIWKNEVPAGKPPGSQQTRCSTGQQQQLLLMRHQPWGSGEGRPALGAPTGLINCSLCRWSMPADPLPQLISIATAPVVVAQTVAQAPETPSVIRRPGASLLPFHPHGYLQ